MPAEVTSVSSRPNCLTVASTAAAIDCRFDTSASTPSASPPDFRIASTTSCTWPSGRPHTATVAPAAARTSAQPRPMPCDPPVMNATLPLQSPTAGRRHRVHHALQVADRVRPPATAVRGRGRIGPGVLVADHCRDVVVDDEAVEAHRRQPPQDGRRGVVALAEEGLLELRDRALHVAHVDVEDLALRPEEIDQLVDARLARHLRHGAEAQVEA